MNSTILGRIISTFHNLPENKKKRRRRKTACISFQWLPDNTKWPKTTEYSLTVLETSLTLVSLGPNQSVSRATLSLELLERICSLPIPASGDYWHSLVCATPLQSLSPSYIVFSSVCNFPLPLSYKDTCDSI